MTKLKVLSIGSDRKLFEEGSGVRRRAVQYGGLFGELHVVVFALRSRGLSAEQAAPNVWLYPTNSRSRWLYVFDAIRVGARIAKERSMSADDSVITAQDPFESGLVALRLKRKLGLPLQIQLHTDLWSERFARSLLNKLRAQIAKRTLKAADGIRVVSDRVRKSLAIHGVKAEKIDALPIFVERGEARGDGAADVRGSFSRFSDIILVASRLEPEKDIGLALDAMKEVIAVRPKAGLIIAGDGRERQALEAKARTLGLGDSVVFVGWQQDLSPYYNAADAYLLTSKFEGYGMSLVEAGLSEAAIVTTDVGIAGDVLKDGENASVCPVGDSECIAKKTLELLGDVELRRRFKGRIAADMRRAIITDTQEYLDRYRDLIEKAHSNHVRNK